MLDAWMGGDNFIGIIILIQGNFKVKVRYDTDKSWEIVSYKRHLGNNAKIARSVEEYQSDIG